MCVNCCQLVVCQTCICYSAGYKQATAHKYDLTVSHTTLLNWWRAYGTEWWLSGVRWIVLWPLMAVAGTDCTCSWCSLDCLHSWSAPVLPDVSLIDQVLALAVWQYCCRMANYNSRLWFVRLLSHAVQFRRTDVLYGQHNWRWANSHVRDSPLSHTVTHVTVWWPWPSPDRSWVRIL